MSETIKFSFTMRVPVPIPCHIRTNDQAEIDISVVGFCEYSVYDEDYYGATRKHLTPCNITAFMCPNCQTDTPPSAWMPVQTSDGYERTQFREFYNSVEYEINQVGATISEYEEAVIAYFTKPVKVERITTYTAAH